MMLTSTSQSLWLLVAGVAVLALARRLFGELRSPLRKVPGPTAARFSRWWYLKNVAKGNFHKVNIDLHRQYGPIVRIAPGQYSLDDPVAFKTIYGSGKGFIKAPWYEASNNPKGTFPDLFTDRNPASHSAHRRMVANLYSATSLRKMETDIDECVEIFLTRLTEFARKGKGNILDLQFWMQCYAFDVIGRLTVAKRFGLLDRVSDDDNIFGSLHDYLKYATVVGVVHELHKPLFWLLTKMPTNGLTRVGIFVANQIKEARQKGAEKNDAIEGQDFLTKLMEINAKNPDKFPDGAIMTTCLTNIGAGSDTTSISLCSILHNIMSSPTIYTKLRKEIDDRLDTLGRTGLIPFKETQSMPYLQACIKEGLRLHPATGLPLARVVPAGGITIKETYFPENTIVGVNTWVAHLNKDVFGTDAADFRPERWLDQKEEKLSAMESYWIPFGAGSRTCVGKNISLLEINKLIPVLVQRFDFTAHRPEDIEHDNCWLVKQQNMMCEVSLRKVA